MPAAEPAAAGAAGSDPYEIVVGSEHLEDKYIDGMLRAKGLDALQIREARSKVRDYLDLLLKDKDVRMTDDVYNLLVNMAIHLIEESSKIE